MKDLQKAIQKILFQNNIRILHRNGWGKDSERYGDAIEFDVKALSAAVEELIQLITSRAQEIADESYLAGVQDFCKWNIQYSDGGYTMDMQNFLAHLAQQKEKR